MEAQQLRRELASRTSQIQELVAAYTELELESESRLGQVELLGRVWAETASASSIALKTLWKHVAPSEGDVTDPHIVRKAVLAAVVQHEEAQRTLARAGLQQLAAGAAAAATDSAALLQALAALPDPLRSAEREEFTVALREVQAALVKSIAERDAAVHELDTARTAALSSAEQVTGLEAEVVALRTEVSELTSQGRQQRDLVAAMSTAASATRSEPETSYEGVMVGGRLLVATDVLALEAEAATLRLQMQEMRQAVAEAAAHSAAATVSAAVAELEIATGRSFLLPAPPRASPSLSSETPKRSTSAGSGGVTAELLVAAISQESAQYLSRATAAEARLAEVTREAEAAEAAHALVAADLRARATAAEASTGLLTRTAAGLRHELQLAQDKYAAQSGVLGMLRQELADAHARLASIQAAKSDMAKKAASALREVEGQVAALTAAVQQMKGQPQGGLQSRSHTLAPQTPAFGDGPGVGRGGF